METWLELDAEGMLGALVPGIGVLVDTHSDTVLVDGQCLVAVRPGVYRMTEVPGYAGQLLDNLELMKVCVRMR